MDRLVSVSAAAGLFLLDKGTDSAYHGKNYLFSRFYNPEVTNNTPVFYLYKQQFEDIMVCVLLTRVRVITTPFSVKSSRSVWNSFIPLLPSCRSFHGCQCICSSSSFSWMHSCCLFMVCFESLSKDLHRRVCSRLFHRTFGWCQRG